MDMTYRLYISLHWNGHPAGLPGHRYKKVFTWFILRVSWQTKLYLVQFVVCMQSQ